MTTAGRVAVLALVALLALGLVARAAHADKLDDARKAIDEVRYDDARRLLVEALEAGGNSPAAVRTIYELSASTAIVLGQRELGEQYYRRWLAIEPTAKLPAGSAPKLVDAFVAAQAYIAAHGRLVVKAERRSATEVDIVVERDPLAMAAAVTANGTPVALSGDKRVRLPAPAEATRITVLDERGNQLVAIDITTPDQPPPIDSPNNPVNGPPVGLPGPTEEPPRPFVKRWTTWGVPAAAFALAGGIFGYLAYTEQTKLDEILERSGEHFFDEVETKRRAVRRYATIGIAFGAAALVLAIPAAIFYKDAARPWKLGRLSLRVHPTGVVGQF